MAQWLEHWIFDQEVLGSNPVGVESFSAMPYFSSLRLLCCKRGKSRYLLDDPRIYKESPLAPDLPIKLSRIDPPVKMEQHMTRDVQYKRARSERRISSVARLYRVQISGSKQAIVYSFVARTKDSVTVFGDHCDSQYQTL